jgi:hypothetical protein
MAGKIIASNILMAAEIQRRKFTPTKDRTRTSMKRKYYPFLVTLEKIEAGVDLALMLSEF